MELEMEEVDDNDDVDVETIDSWDDTKIVGWYSDVDSIILNLYLFERGVW